MKKLMLFTFILAGFIFISLHTIRGIILWNLTQIKNSSEGNCQDVGEVVRVFDFQTSDPNLLFVPNINMPINVASGSGVAVKRGYILSSAHIFSQKESNPFANYQSAKIIKKDEKIDLILLKIPKAMKSFKIASSIRVGEEVTVIGYPAGIDVFLFGHVANFNKEIILLDIKVIKGASGGAVINKKGELLGIFKGGIGEPDMMGIAINYPRIKKFLEKTPAKYK